MRIIVLLVLTLITHFLTSAQERTLHVNGSYYFLTKNVFKKVDKGAVVISSFESNGFDQFTSVDVSNPHYIVLFSEESQKVWILDNEMALFDEILLYNKVKNEISKLFLMNQTLYLYSDEGNKWFIYDVNTNQIILEKEIPYNLPRDVSFSASGGDVFFYSTKSIWKTDIYDNWDGYDWRRSENLIKACRSLNYRITIQIDGSHYLANLDCGSYINYPILNNLESFSILGEHLFYLKGEEIHSERLKLTID